MSGSASEGRLAFPSLGDSGSGTPAFAMPVPPVSESGVPESHGFGPGAQDDSGVATPPFLESAEDTGGWTPEPPRMADPFNSGGGGGYADASPTVAAPAPPRSSFATPPFVGPGIPAPEVPEQRSFSAPPIPAAPEGYVGQAPTTPPFGPDSGYGGYAAGPAPTAPPYGPPSGAEGYQGQAPATPPYGPPSDSGGFRGPAPTTPPFTGPASESANFGGQAPATPPFTAPPIPGPGPAASDSFGAQAPGIPPYTPQRAPEPDQSGTASPFAPTQVAQPASSPVAPTRAVPAARPAHETADDAMTRVVPAAQPPMAAPPIPQAPPAPSPGPQAGVYPAAQVQAQQGYQQGQAQQGYQQGQPQQGYQQAPAQPQPQAQQSPFAPTQAVPSLQQPPQPQPAFQFPPAGHQAPSLPQTPTPQETNQPPAPDAGGKGSQSYRIRLRTADGKRFDGPDITTKPAGSAPWDNDPHVAGGMTVVPAPPVMSAPWGVDDQGRKKAPKVVVRLGKREKAVHVLAVLGISLVLCAPLAFLAKQAIDKHLDKVAATITVPTKVNELDTTSEIYLGAMGLVVILVVLVYRIVWKRRRTR